MSNSTLCTMAEKALSESSGGSSISCLTRDETIGLAVITESGFISLVAVVGVLALIFVSINLPDVTSLMTITAQRNAIRSRRLIRQTTDIYMISLFLFDLVAAIGKTIFVKWLHEGKVYTGGFCTAQGVLMQLGDAGSALATLAIAIHTFVVVMWGLYRRPYFIAYTAVGITWLFLAIFIAVHVTAHNRGASLFYTPVGYWCFIGNNHNIERYTGQYVWILLTMFVSLITYTLLSFWARGNLTVSPTHWWKFRVYADSIVQEVDPDGCRRRAIGMIAYPVVFIIVSLPLTIIRLKTHFGSVGNLSPNFTLAVESIYALAGAFNVLLFIFTRSDLLFSRNLSDRRVILGMGIPGISDTDVIGQDLSNSMLNAGEKLQGGQP
ncbi:hypothetical protein PILCRDRAFT_826830 [Piloderma croceum F 1598]|uniref:G-protein coupled receptors family 1 profile domain-containing protein n=1 Tax=Piloderma croceum (strain F 1598) TaxID=765440 RepID=A0A0C3F7S2_PILCF|nr:hypothetical protein PILCRDRAFT_826830 [Piloderma croceum F 1598]